MTPKTPATPEELFARFEQLGIAYKTHEHPPLFTVEESKRLRGDLPGGHCKNLFLRDKKRNLFLLVALEDRPVDLKSLRRVLGAAGNLSFGQADLLMEALGVEPGAVTPFALINDAARRVAVFLDQAMLAHDPLNFHPLSNAMTTAVSPKDLVRFIEPCGHAPKTVDLGG
ncbi:MAG: prolyl-tRNA synthetase associated domain-containing protein [Rhodospirillales bacterium]